MQSFSYKGPIPEAKAEAAQWRRLGKALVSTIKTKSYHQNMQAFVGNMVGKKVAKGGYSEKWVTMLAALPDKAIEILVKVSTTAPKGCEAMVIIQRLGGKIERPDSGVDSSAYAHRAAGYWISIICVTSKPGQPEDSRKAEQTEAWIAKAVADLRPHIITADGVGCIAPSFGPPTGPVLDPINVFGDKMRLDKLRAIKVKFDPTNLFSAVENGMCGAHNIDPTTPV